MLPSTIVFSPRHEMFLGRAMVKLYEAGYWDYALLPIHDEILFSFPEETAVEMCREAGVVMEMILKEVHISTEPDLGESRGVRAYGRRT